MPRKYNPALKYVVDNHREKAKEHNLRTDHLTDSQVFDLIEGASGFSTHEEDMEQFLEDLKETQPSE